MLVPAPSYFAKINEFLDGRGHEAIDLVSCLLDYLNENRTSADQDRLHDSHQAWMYRGVVVEFCRLIIQELPEGDKAQLQFLLNQLS